MPPDTHRGRPAEAAPTDKTAVGSGTSIIAPTTLIHPKAVAPAYAVFTFHDDGQLTRRGLYLSLHSAIKAKERAEDKGQRFELMLVELVPVPATPVIVVGGHAA